LINRSPVGLREKVKDVIFAEPEVAFVNPTEK
jgi:hypothetical protein